jgi:hypothetical protein
MRKRSYFSASVHVIFPVVNPLVTFSYTPPTGLEVSTEWDIAMGRGTVLSRYMTELSVSPLHLHVTPEPMTIVILGLGGLFLLRRK